MNDSTARRMCLGGWVVTVLMAGGCTMVNTATVPSEPGRRGALFVTAEAVQQHYESLGPVQATHKGVLLFGFADPANTSIQEGLNRSLLPMVHQMGGDGVMNLRFEQTQYSLPTRILFAILFFIPLPSETTVAGEVVRLHPKG